MEVKDAIYKRRSVRKFTEDPVSEADLECLLHAAMSGPSACNKTPWEFYIVQNPSVLEALKASGRFTKITAPMAIVVCGNTERTLPLQFADYWIQDCSAATENILLQAVELGLGCCWCGVHLQKHVEEKVRAALNLPESLKPLNILYIGHPAETPSPKDGFNEAYTHYIK